MTGAGGSARRGGDAAPGGTDDGARERLLAALPPEARELLERFEHSVRADERRLSAMRYAGGRAGGSAPTPDQALGAALSAEISDGPLSYCGPEELMRLLAAELEAEEPEPA